MGRSPKRVLVWGPRRDARPAGERRSGGALEGYPKRKRGDPTWSAARDDAYAQKERPGGEPYRLSPSGDSALPKATTNYPRRVGVLTKPCKRPRPAEGEMKLRHGFCRQSLRLISFATSLCTREAFAARRLPTRPQNSFTTFFTEKQCRPCLRGTQKEKRRPRRGTGSVFSRSVGKGFYVTLSERNR